MLETRSAPDLRIDPGTLTLSLATADRNPLLTSERLFRLEVDGHTRERLVDARVDAGPDAVIVSGTVEGTELGIVWTATQVAGPGVWEFGLRLTNRGASDVRVSRMDPFVAVLLDARWDARYFESTWGGEFSPAVQEGFAELSLESRSGRSSHGYSPWLGLQSRPGAVVVAPAWSGNWHIDVGPEHEVSAGVSPWNFFTDLAPAGEVNAPSVVVAIGTDQEDAAEALTTAIGRNWIPRSDTSDAMRVEWNHWWPYEDGDVNEAVIAQNAAIAADLGVGVCTVDAGWFGASDADSVWQLQRGDWHLVNAERFPSGLAALGRSIRETGAAPGIWLEAEAVGAGATLRREHAEIIARGDAGFERDESYPQGWTGGLDPDDPTFLGYVCLGSPGGREHALRSLNSAVQTMGAEWIKLDFNIDPDRGCTRTDHGHGAGDGLLRHYEGLYAVIDEFRAQNPSVVFEACASGGLRVDLGLARHVHCFFLSDPDYTDHHLQVFWGTSLLLPPAAMLHWSWSQYRMEFPDGDLDFGTLDIRDFDTLLRAAMLQRFGFSLRLPELSAEQLESLRRHTRIFTDSVAPFVRNGTVRRLTGQPLRRGEGERAPVFQLSDGERHLVAAYQLSGGEVSERIRPRGLGEGTSFRVTDLVTGAESVLEQGSFPVDRSDPCVTSWLWTVEPVR